MFKPDGGRIVTEEFEDASGFTLAASVELDGALRLSPSLVVPGPDQYGLNKVPWGFTDGLNSVPLDTGNWLEVGSPTIGTERGFLILSAGTGVDEYITQDNTHHWGNVSNAGWTVEMRMQQQAGRSVFDFDDGAIAGRVHFTPDKAVLIPDRTGEYVDTGNYVVYTDWHEIPRTIRISVADNRFRMSIENGTSLDAEVEGWAPVGTKEFKLGSLSSLNAPGTLNIDYLNIESTQDSHEGRRVVTFDTGAQTSFTPSYRPKLKARKFKKAIYNTSTIGAGTTVITPQYRGDTGDSWVDLSPTTITSTTMDQSLTGTDLTGDFTDYLRFKIDQTSDGTTGEPPRVESISVITTAQEGTLRVSPSWGHKNGGNTVALDVIRGVTEALPIDASDIIYFLHADDAVSDQSNNSLTLTETEHTGELLKTDSYVDIMSQEGEHPGSYFDATLTGYSSTSYGDQGSDITVVNGTGSNPALAKATVFHPIDQANENAQHVTAGADGRGISIPAITGLTAYGSGDVGEAYALEFILEVESGQVAVTATGATINEAVFDRQTAKLHRIYFRPTSTSSTFTFAASGGPATFTLGAVSAYTAHAGHLSVANNTAFEESDVTLHAGVYLYGYSMDRAPAISSWNSNSGWELGVTAAGYPYLMSGTGEVIGQVQVPQRRLCTISGNLSEVGGDTVLTLQMNGELAGYQRVTGTLTDPTNELHFGHREGDDDHFLAGRLYSPRVRTPALSTFDTSHDLSRRTVPRFECEYEPLLDTGSHVYLMFNRRSGLIENKGDLSDAILPHVARPYTYRGIGGVLGDAIRFMRYSDDRHGYLHIPYVGPWDLDSSYEIEFWVRSPVEARERCILARVTNSLSGIRVYLDSSGKIAVHSKGGTSQYDETGSSDLSDTGWHHVFVRNIRDTGGTDDLIVEIDGLEEINASGTAIGSVSSATDGLYIGALEDGSDGSNIDLDGLSIRAGTDNNPAYPKDTSHWSPTEPVALDGFTLHSSRIEHVTPGRKHILMPAYPAGSYHLKVGSDSYYTINPYSYVRGYNRVIDTGEISAEFGDILSPFRILHRVPDHGVPLALVGNTPLGVETHMSISDLSDHEPANRTGYGVEDGVLRGADTGVFDFPNAVETDEILVSNRAQLRKDLSAPRPLFYKYLVGRGRYGVQALDASDTGSVDTIRNGIRVFQTRGKRAEVAWDISVSDLDYYGNSLPSNIYSVVLMVDRIPSKTLWVEYRAADGYTSHTEITRRREVVNPIPLFGTESGRLNFSAGLNITGSYDITVDP